jgi:hypothetical protein
MGNDLPVIVDAERLHAVFEELRNASKLRASAVARRLLSLMLAYLCPETGLVELSRDDMARRLQCSPAQISDALGLLHELGAVAREYRSVPGAGRGAQVLAYVDPALAWSGPADARARWQAAPGVQFGPRPHRTRISRRAGH